MVVSVDQRLALLGRSLRPGDLEPAMRDGYELGKTITAAQYIAAINRFHAMGRIMDACLAGVDVLMTPTLVQLPAPLGELAMLGSFKDFRRKMSRYSTFLAIVNASGQPAASLPTYWTADMLPVGTPDRRPLRQGRPASSARRRARTHRRVAIDASRRTEPMIRPLLSSDRDAWLQLWRGYQAFYAVQIPPAVTDTTWSRLFDAAEPMHCAVAEEDGVVVGIVHYIFHRSTWTEGEYSLSARPVRVVRRAWSRLRPAAHRACYAQAQAQQAARVYWLTHESNQQAMVLYDKVAKRSGCIQYRHVLG